LLNSRPGRIPHKAGAQAVAAGLNIAARQDRVRAKGARCLRGVRNAGIQTPVIVDFPGSLEEVVVDASRLLRLGVIGCGGLIGWRKDSGRDRRIFAREAGEQAEVVCQMSFEGCSGNDFLKLRLVVVAEAGFHIFKIWIVFVQVVMGPFRA